MTGPDEVREKLKEIRATVLREISEALALLESEPSEQMRRDHEAMEILRGNLGAGPRPISLRLLIDGQWKAANSARIHHANDPADAILGTESEATS